MLLIVCYAVFCDLKTHRIPNRLCVYGIVCGLLTALMGIGTVTPQQSIVGIILPVVGLFLLYVLRILGAGDIKLFSAVGAFVGFCVWKIICFSMVFGAFAGAVVVLRRLSRCIKSGRSAAAEFLSEGLTGICFSVPIALGTSVYILEEVLSGGI